MRAVPLTLLCLLSMTMVTAHAAGINKCSVDGRLVFQAAPCALDARAGGAAAPTAPAAANDGTPKKRTLADVLRERDGPAPSQPVAREPQRDGAHVLRARMGAF